METSHFRKLYDQYAAAVAYICVRKPDGSEGIGSAFHVGSGVFVTARHVVEGNTILSIATTEHRVDPVDENPMAYTITTPGEGRIKVGPLYHPDPQVDVAALVVDGIRAPRIPLGFHTDDMIDNGLVLAPVLVMGYPPIPLSDKPVLVASIAEVNAIVDKYIGNRHPHFIVSTMARGGFSGGVAIAYDFVLGVIVEALNMNDQPVELGYLTVLTVEPIYNCLAHHDIMPQEVLQDWKEGKNRGEFWADLTSHKNRSVIALIAKDLNEIIANEPNLDILSQQIDEYISSHSRQPDAPPDVQAD